MTTRRRTVRRRLTYTAAAAAVALWAASAARGQPATVPSPPTERSAVAPELIGRRVDEIRIVGNAQVSSQVILNVVRTRVGQPFDPATVADDYQRVFNLHQFSNVRADVAWNDDPTAEGGTRGVIVTFQVAEEKLIHAVRFVGNSAIAADDLKKDVDLKVGEAIEPFRLALAERAVVVAYRQKNYPYASVEEDKAELSRTGDLVLRVTQGPQVRVRDINFVGGHSFTFDTLNDQVKTARWFFFFSDGTLDADQVEQDVASLKRYYLGKGFFDVKVGRKIVVSPDRTEVSVDFVIDEGPRYRVGRITFDGNTKVPSAKLREGLKLNEGQNFDAEILERDVQSVVKAYSPLGYIYDPRSNNPDYLRIGDPSLPFGVRTVIHDDPGTVDLVYGIGEGKPFRIGNVTVVGNAKTYESVVRNLMRDLQPGQLYNSGAVSDDAERLRGTPYFDRSSTITPIGNDPGVRDLLVQVKEVQTAKIGASARYDSNYGLGGELSYEQDNFDLLNVPRRFDDLPAERAFTGAGQTFRATFAPGLRRTDGSVLFSDPFVLDQPYSNTDEGYFRQIAREWGFEQHAGGSITIGKQFDPNWSAGVVFQGEDVKISDVQDFYPLSDRVDVIDPVTHQPRINPGNGDVQTQTRSVRAPDVLRHTGHNTVTDVGLRVARDTTNRGPLLFEGTLLKLNYYYFGGLGGQYHYSQFTAGGNLYQTIYTDLLDRKTVLELGIDSGYDLTDAPFFERFYGGGLGSVRGFQFRGVGPRAGRALDPIGGDLTLTGKVELNFPVFGDNFRGVVFDDFGTVEPDIRIHTIRDSVGVGVRVTLPALGFRTPLGFNLAFPISKGGQDITEVFSFTVGR